MPTVTAESRQYCTLLPRHAMRQEENRRIKDPRYLTPDLYRQCHPNTLHRSLLLLSPLYLCVYLCQHRYSAVLRSAVFYSELLSSILNSCFLFCSVLFCSVLISSNLHCTVPRCTAVQQCVLHSHHTSNISTHHWQHRARFIKLKTDSPIHITTPSFPPSFPPSCCVTHLRSTHAGCLSTDG